MLRQNSEQQVIYRKNGLIRYFFLVLTTFLLYIVALNLMDDLRFYSYESLTSLSYTLNWIGIFIFMYSIFSWYRINRTLFEPYVIFWLFFFLFNYGQCAMWAFGIHLPTEIGAFSPYGLKMSKLDVVRSQLVTCLGMLVFHVGSMYSINLASQKKVIEQPLFINNIVINKVMKNMGIVLALISFIPTFYRSFKFFFAAQKYGYAALYYSGQVEQGGLLMILEFFFFPAILCLLIGYEYKKGIRYLIYFIFSIYLVINLLSGDRGSWIYKLLVLLWLHSKYVKKISISKAIIYTILSLIGVYGLYVIVAFRDTGLNNISVNSATNIMFGNQSPIIHAFFEMGGSLSIVAMVIGCDIRSSWLYGNTYLISLAGVFSSRLLSMLGIPVILVDDWLSQEYLGISWGTGFSMIGEAYLNGGMLFAPAYLFLLGLLLGRILLINRHSSVEKNPLTYFFVASSLQTWIGFSRGSSFLYFKTWFWGTFVVFALMKFVVSMNIKSKYGLKVG